MVKDDIVYEVSKIEGMTLRQSKEAVDVMFESIKKALVEGERLEFRGFGSFTIVERKGKIGQDITRGKSVYIPQHKAVRFKASKVLKSLI